ncbi:MAG: RAMP superfamily CRISPR-associated protein [Thermofilum sp.]
MIKFGLRLKAVTLLTVGWGIPEVMGADVVHARKPVGSRYELYIPGSSVKGALRSSASRVAAHYGFTSCGEVEPSRIAEAHRAMGRACSVCELFGWPGGNGALLHVGDFRLVGETATEVVSRVSLNDKTLTAERGKLYSMEHLPPGAEFKGEVRLIGERRDLLPLLLLAVAELRTGRIGRRSIVDAKLEDEGLLDALVGEEWRQLLSELRSWLWVGVVGP